MNLLLAALFFSAPAVPVLPQEPVFRRVSYEQALELAGEEDRLAVVVFVTRDCADCERLRDKTWSNAAVERWLEVEAIAVEVDGAERADLAQRLDIQRYPTTLILEQDGTEYDRMVGFIKAKRFVAGFKGIHEGRLLLRQARTRLAEDPGDPTLHLDVARALVTVGRTRSAVDAYETIWTDFRGPPEHRRIRLVKVLTELEAMSGPHPPARQAMARWRLEARRIVRGEQAGDPAEAARELSALCKHLVDLKTMLETWTEMREREGTPAEVLDELFDETVIGQLYNQRRYEELLAGLRDPLARVQGLIDEVDEFRLRERDGRLQGDEVYAVLVLQNSLYSKSSLYFEVLLKVGREEDALEIQEYVLGREATGQAYVSMMNAARNARRRDLARKIGDAGLEILEKKERRHLRDAYERTFRSPR